MASGKQGTGKQELIPGVADLVFCIAGFSLMHAAVLTLRQPSQDTHDGVSPSSAVNIIVPRLPKASLELPRHTSCLMKSSLDDRGLAYRQRQRFHFGRPILTHSLVLRPLLAVFYEPDSAIRKPRPSSIHPSIIAGKGLHPFPMDLLRDDRSVAPSVR
jgi:hypothetical protein